MDTLREGDCTLHRIPRKSLPQAYPNMFVYDDQEFMAFVKRLDSEFVYLRCDSRDNLMHKRFWGLAPRNLEQAMAMSLLDDDGVDMTVMTGPAGSGKTLLALSYGLHAILEQKQVQQVDRGTLYAAHRRGNRLSAGHRGGENGALAGGLR